MNTKKIDRIFALAVMSFAFVAGAHILTACGGETSEHVHTFDTSSWVNTDPDYHWHKATCEHTDEVTDKAKHEFVDYVCKVCGYEKQFEGTKLTEDKSYSVATLVYGDTRIQLLTDSLVRIENKSNGKYEDRNSYIVYNRDSFGDKVTYSTQRTDDGYKISTQNYTVNIPTGSKAEGMYITDANGERIFTYMGVTGTNLYLPSPSDELSSWYFTDSPRVIPSEYGYSVSSNTAPKQGWEFDENATDIFVFLPHGDYKTFTSDYVALTGRTEMLPLKTLGYWESRYHAYTQEEAMGTIDGYLDREYSLDTFTVDTDWRVGGGVGYEINTELFPDMKGFLQQAHEKGLNILFNDHPEPKSGTTNLLDKDEVAYRNENLLELMKLGVDYWYFDRNWSVALNRIHPAYSRYATGMYAYHWITSKYYEDLAKDGEYARRTMMQANVDGCFNGSWVYASDISAHRYAIQWTGDTGTDESWLQEELEGAVMAGAEIGLPFVSADLGGHKAQNSPNSYMRWMQYGALSPVMRTQCTNTENGRMPWLYGDTAEEVVHTYQDIRYRLLPLYYALTRENYETGLPVIRRLDIKYPQYVEASRNDEYLLGDNILVAPISEAKGNDKRDVFLPDGKWIDVWSGKRYVGPQTIEVAHGIKTSPIFVREGSLVALARNMQNVDKKDWSELSLDVYPSADYSAETTVYEDDAETLAYADGKYRKTDISMNCDGNTLKINIGKASGSFDGKRAFTDRKWNVRLHKNPDWGDIKSVKVNGKAVTTTAVAAISYDNGGRPFAFSGGALDGDINTFTVDTNVDSAYEIEIEYASTAASGTNADYDDTGVSFKISSSAYSETGINLTELGATDWVSFGYNSGIGIDYKKNGPRLFSSPKNSRELVNSICSADHMAAPFKSGAEKTYTDGSRKSSQTVRGGTKNAIGYNFTVKTTGAREKIVLYIGGNNCISKLTVRDRAGNVKTLRFGGRSKNDFIQKVEIDIEAGEAGELFMTYSPIVSTLKSERETDARVSLYCGYIAPRD